MFHEAPYQFSFNKISLIPVCLGRPTYINTYTCFCLSRMLIYSLKQFPRTFRRPSRHNNTSVFPFLKTIWWYDRLDSVIQTIFHYKRFPFPTTIFNYYRFISSDFPFPTTNCSCGRLVSIIQATFRSLQRIVAVIVLSQ